MLCFGVDIGHQYVVPAECQVQFSTQKRDEVWGQSSCRPHKMQFLFTPNSTLTGTEFPITDICDQIDLKIYVFLKPHTPSCLLKSIFKWSPSIMLFCNLTSTNALVGLNEAQWLHSQAAIFAHQIMLALPDAALKKTSPLPLRLNKNFNNCWSRLLLCERFTLGGLKSPLGDVKFSGGFLLAQLFHRGKRF